MTFCRPNWKLASQWLPQKEANGMFPLDFGIMENNNYNNYLDLYSAFHIPKATFTKYIWQTYAYDNYVLFYKNISTY